MEPESEKMFQNLHCYHCSLNFLNSYELKSHECSKGDEESNSSDSPVIKREEEEDEEEEEASLTDMDVDLKEEAEENENDQPANFNLNSDFNPVNQQQQSNICLIGEDKIEVNCKKCSTDFSSLKLFLDHLQRKPHQNVISQISKENQRPSNRNSLVRNSTVKSKSSKQITCDTNKVKSRNLSQKKSEESTSFQNDFEFDPGSTFDSNNERESSSSSESESDLELDPKSDPLQLTPSDVKTSAKFKCVFCEQCMNSEKMLKIHMNKTIPSTKCIKSDCPFTFTLACALLKHNESHRKEFECQANTQKNSPKTYSRVHRPYSDKQSTTTTTTPTQSSFTQAFAYFLKNPTEPRKETSKSHQFQCNLEHCLKTFDKKNELTRHIHGHEMNEKFQKYIRCPLPDCQKPFGRKRQMYLYHAHMENHKHGITFKCRKNSSSCSMEFERLVDLNRHEMKCKPPGRTSNRNTKTNTNVKPTPKTSTESKFTSHRCPFCTANVWFPGKHSFVFHINKVHPEKTQEDIDKALEPPFIETASKKFKCTNPDCAHLEFESIKQVTFHNKRIHRKIVVSRPALPKIKKVELILPCTYDGCTRNFKSEVKIRAHILRVHENQKSERIKKIHKSHLCSQCGKIFRDNSKLKVHELTHSDKRNFKCNVCEQFFKSKSTLRRHKITHTDLRKYLCSQCGRAFRTSDAHNVHMRTHTQERRFKCPICPNVGYNHKVTLKGHMKNHPDWEGQL